MEQTHMKHILFSSLLFLLSLTALAQDTEEGKEEEPKKGFQKEALFVGGNFGLSFGDYTVINLSPQLGYRFNRFLAAGVGINGQYVSVRDRYVNGGTFRKTSQGVVGLNLFGRVYPIEQVMLQVQPEFNYIFGKETYFDTNPRTEYKMDAEIIPSLLLGGGVVIPGGRSSAMIYLMYDVLQKDNSPYGKKPFINFGVNLNLY